MCVWVCGVCVVVCRGVGGVCGQVCGVCRGVWGCVGVCGSV